MWSRAAGVWLRLFAVRAVVSSSSSCASPFLSSTAAPREEEVSDMYVCMRCAYMYVCASSTILLFGRARRCLFWNVPDRFNQSKRSDYPERTSDGSATARGSLAVGCASYWATAGFQIILSSVVIRGYVTYVCIYPSIDFSTCAAARNDRDGILWWINSWGWFEFIYGALQVILDV